MIALLVLAGLAAAWYATRDSGSNSSSSRTSGPTTVAPVAARAKPRTQTRQTTETAAQVVVPDVVGQQRDDALGTLEAQGLRASVREVPSDQAPGVVVAQAPRGGSKADKASSVAINVSSGPAKPVAVTVTVPDVVGQPKDSAKGAIRAAGLEPSTADVPSTQARGTVVSQSPGGGATARKGDHVLFNVSAGAPESKPKGKAKGRAKHKVERPKQDKSQQPEAASVPSVVGEDEGAASADLQNAGFSVSTVDQQTGDANEDGVVVDQSPAGGSSADAASTVTIYVGRYSGG